MGKSKFRITIHCASVLIVFCTLYQGGCGRRTEPAPFQGFDGIGWNSTDDGAIPGIDQAKVAWWMEDDRLAYVVWTDLKGDGGGRSFGGGSGPDGFVAHAQLSSDNNRLDYEHVADADSGITLTIDNVGYSLNDGALLLVSTRADKIRVKQLDLSASSFDFLIDYSRTSRQTSSRAAVLRRPQPRNQEEFLRAQEESKSARAQKQKESLRALEESLRAGEQSVRAALQETAISNPDIKSFFEDVRSNEFESPSGGVSGATISTSSDTGSLAR